jgi:hypothetical protein
VSTLWTPEGEHRVRAPADGAPDPDPGPGPSRPAPAPAGGGRQRPPAGAGAGPDDDLSPEEQAELAGRLDELRRQLLGTPAEVVVANHAYGLFELAAIHLSQQPPRLDQARLAVDAMGALVESLAGRLGDAELSLRDALTQIRLAFVEIGGQPATATGDDAAGGTGEGGDAPGG